MVNTRLLAARLPVRRKHQPRSDADGQGAGAFGYSRNTRVRVTVGGVSCDFDVTSELPDYVPDAIAYDGQDVIYLLSISNRFVFRWSIPEAHYLDPYDVGSVALAPTTMAFSTAHHRLYLGYDTGAIRQIDVNAATPAEVAFASLAAAVTSLGSAGNFLIAQAGQYNYGGGQVINASGVTTANGGYYYGYSRESAWDPVTSRVYYTRDGISPNDLHYDVIDQTTGAVSSTDETPYHGSYNIQPPIRVSVDGQYVLLGSGDIYRQPALNWSGSLGSQVADARWFTNGSLVTLRTSGNQTTLRRLAATNLGVQEQLTYTGQGLRVVGTDARMAVLVINNNTVQIYTYVPSDDSDGDGVVNTADAFPLDRAASVDTDRDGYPDAWNTGRTQADSTTGLTLDAFPQDSACWLAAHGSGTTCNYGATIPNYIPDQVVQNGDTIYLLSTANRRVYRWSISTGAYLNPYVVGINQGFSTIAPTKMAFSSAHQRVYLGYETGAIRYIDVTAASPVETAFATTALGVNGLAAVGNYVLAQDRQRCLGDALHHQQRRRYHRFAGVELLLDENTPGIRTPRACTSSATTPVLTTCTMKSSIREPDRSVRRAKRLTTVRMASSRRFACRPTDSTCCWAAATFIPRTA